MLKCGTMVIAQAETSYTTGKIRRYYACVSQKKHKCDKKMLYKEKLENFIVLQSDRDIERGPCYCGTCCNAL